MHIALIIPSLRVGGAERVLSELANAWVSEGYDISLITLCHPKERPAYELNPHIDLIQVNQESLLWQPFYMRLFNILFRVFRIRSVLKRRKPDIIISFIDVMNITTLLATRFLFIPVIVAERTHPAFYYLPKFYKFMRFITYYWAAKVVAQTQFALDYFSSLPNDRKVVIPNIVRQPKSQKTEDEITRPVLKIVSLGRLVKSKGYHLLIRAFANARELHPDLKLIIYGEGPERAALEKDIIVHDLENIVSLPGVVKDIETALLDADLFVFPSFFEGFPNALCEAMAIGLPVIASNCSGNIDIVQDGLDGRLFNVGDEMQLQRLIQELIQDPSQRLRLSQGALRIVERFGEKSILQMWDDVFTEVTR